MPYVTASYVFSYTWPVKTIQSACVVRPAAVVSGKKKIAQNEKEKRVVVGSVRRNSLSKMIFVLLEKLKFFKADPNHAAYRLTPTMLPIG